MLNEQKLVGRKKSEWTRMKNTDTHHFLLANVNVRSLYVIARPSVCRLSSVTLVHPTQVIEIFHNVSTPFGTLATHDIQVKFYRDRPSGTLRRGS